MLDYERSLCSELVVSASREWLVTNGIGGFASGTVAGILTRRYHGLLMAALKPPVGRTLMVAKLDDTVEYDGRAYALYADRFDDGAVFPRGFKHLERFHLEGTIPVWTFSFADVLLEKRIWMQQDANTTYIHYTLRRGLRPLTLTLAALVNYRDYHALMHPGKQAMQLKETEYGWRVTAHDGARSFYVLCSKGQSEAYGDWLAGYFLSVEHSRGYDTVEDHYHAATFYAELNAGESVTVVASTESMPNLDGEMAYQERRAYEQNLIVQSADQNSPIWTQQLVLAADQFIVKRTFGEGKNASHESEGRSVIAGYPWFSDWGRDTMISLSGLTLATQRFDVAQSILRTFAHFVSEGMLPNRFPDAGEAPEYNTVDATLWYFDAVRAYFEATGDVDLLRELFPALREIIDFHTRGTRYNICVDQQDGLLYAGMAGVQLTWMDAKFEDWVVTPRIGKPIEVNALWYNALRIMAIFAEKLDEASDVYTAAADKTQSGFSRFWNNEIGWCYDVLDVPEGGHDSSLRPNQLLAISLTHTPLTSEQQKAVVDVCALHLLTPCGLRSLAPDEPGYAGHYVGDLRARDGAYHEGTVWSWLIGPFASAHLRVYGDKSLARTFIMPLIRHLDGGCIGTINEIFDGDPPHAPRGCFAQAWSVAELLRVWRQIS